MISLDPSLPEPSPELEVCVVIPAKNEAVRLRGALRALAQQEASDGTPFPPERWEVLLLINNSSDQSFAVACEFKRRHPAFPLHIIECHLSAERAHVGHVRKLLMDTACERLLRRPKAPSLIMSTDADSEVAQDWIAQNLAEIYGGAQAVGGRITLHADDVDRLSSQTRRIQETHDRYELLLSWLEDNCDPQPHDPWPRHHQHFGSSLAVLPSVYYQVGGVPAQKYLEDVALYDALVRRDVKFRHSPYVCVRTSGRLKGRATVGLAEQLSRWSHGSPRIHVPSVFLFETLYSLRRNLRVWWQRVQSGEIVSECVLEQLSKALNASRTEVWNALQCSWFGAAFEGLDVRSKLENGPFRKASSQPLDEAVCQLERFSSANQLPDRPVAREVQYGIAGLESV